MTWVTGLTFSPLTGYTVPAKEVKVGKMGTLYVVDVPTGNLEDTTLRAVRVLREVSLILAQDISWAEGFLAHWGIDTPLAGCVEGESEAGERVVVGVESLLEALQHTDVALLCETERPSSSARVQRVVRAAVERDFPVVSVPGPSAAVTALILSGLPADGFVCLGFLPQRVAERRELLAFVAAERRTLVAFVMPDCLLPALHDVADTLGDRPLCMAKTHDGLDGTVWRGRVREAMAQGRPNSLRDEWVLVIGGAEEEPHWPEARVRSELARLLAEGQSRKAAAQQVARACGWRPREVYRLAADEVAQNGGT